MLLLLQSLLQVLTEKKSITQKGENFVLFARLAEDLNLGGSLLNSSRNCSEKVREDFPGGTVDGNPPGNSGDMVRSWSHVLQLLKPRN